MIYCTFSATPPITTTTKEPTTPIQQKTSAPLHFKEPTIPIRVNPQYTEPENKLPFGKYTKNKIKSQQGEKGGHLV